MVTFAVEPLDTCWGEVYDPPDGLAYQHWCETQGFRHYQGYAPSRERYTQYERAGWFLQFTVRDEGKLVGYGGAYIVPSMHSQRLISTEDTWYLAPEYRKGWTAIKFYRFMEQVVKDRGAVEANLTLPTEKNLDAIVMRLGYTCQAKLYSKQLVRADSAPTSEKSEDVRTVATAPT